MTARKTERFQSECWSSKRCLRGQEEKIGREKRKGAHSSNSHVLVEQTNRRLQRCSGYENSCNYLIGSKPLSTFSERKPHCREWRADAT